MSQPVHTSDWLQRILHHKEQTELPSLRQRYALAELRLSLPQGPDLFTPALQQAARTGKPFWIGEFKRASPSLGEINTQAQPEALATAYAQAGATGVSVLTDEHFFQGGYAYLNRAAQALAGTGVVLLQKDFIIHEDQLTLGRAHGAHGALLIAAALTPDRLQALAAYARQIGLGVLLEVHTPEDLHKIRGLHFPVVGVNHRSLRTLRLSLGAGFTLAPQLPPGVVSLAESGLLTAFDYAVAARWAQGFLVGSAFMQGGAPQALSITPYVLKACGVRHPAWLAPPAAPLLGINISPHSRRRMPLDQLRGVPLPPQAVLVCAGNPMDEIAATLQQYPFRYVQVYDHDLTPDQVQQLPARVLLGLKADMHGTLAQRAAPYAPHVDAFILDGTQPGSGRPNPTSEAELQAFPYPFLLAGGMTAAQAPRITHYPMCVGLDVAGALEDELHLPSRTRLQHLLNAVAELNLRHIAAQAHPITL